MMFANIEVMMSYRYVTLDKQKKMRHSFFISILNYACEQNTADGGKLRIFHLVKFESPKWSKYAILYGFDLNLQHESKN